MSLIHNLKIRIYFMDMVQQIKCSIIKEIAQYGGHEKKNWYFEPYPTFLFRYIFFIC